MLKMKHSLILFVALVLASLTSVAFADDATGPKVDLTLLQGLVVAVIPVITGVLLQLTKKLVAFVPNEWLPVLAPIVGVLIMAVGQAFGVDLTPGVDGAGAIPVAGALGMTAVGGHQIKVQATS